MKLLCKIIGHDLSNEYTQPEPRFERVWNKYFGDALWMEVFIHECNRCPMKFKFWRWTRAAAKKNTEDI